MNTEIISFNTREFQVDDYKACYNRGNALANEGCYSEALASFDQALAIQPYDHAAWIFRAVVLIQLNRYSEALASCETALAIQPHNQQAWICRGAALHYLGHYKQSYASYDQALGIQQQSGWQKLTQMLKGFFRRGNDGTTGKTIVTS